MTPNIYIRFLYKTNLTRKIIYSYFEDGLICLFALTVVYGISILM